MLMYTYMSVIARRIFSLFFSFIYIYIYIYIFFFFLVITILVLLFDGSKREWNLANFYSILLYELMYLIITLCINCWKIVF